MLRPSRDDFRALARAHTVVPVWREILGDLITPVAAFLRCVGDGPGFLLESVEHGDRWSRFSFVGRNPSATLVARGGRIDVEGRLLASVPLDRGVLAALEALLAVHRSPSIPELPPLHAVLDGLSGLGPTCRATTRAIPTRCCRSSASWPPSTTGASASH